MDRCLITGCGGFVGSYLAEYLLSHGCQVAGVVRRDSAHLRDLAGRVEIFTCDVTDRLSFTRIIQEVGPRFVFHLAAEDVIPRSWGDPKTTIETNVIGTISILEGVREVAAGAVVQVAGSASEYGRRRPRELPVREAQVPPSPESLRGQQNGGDPVGPNSTRPGTRCACTAFARFSSSGPGSFLMWCRSS
jgi:GDP-D-mannose dehydratase